jgi:hypothetical protein
MEPDMTVTVERMREQYARNAKQMRDMLAKAREVAPRKHRGYTVAHLEEAVARFEKMASGELPPGTPRVER